MARQNKVSVFHKTKKDIDGELDTMFVNQDSDKLQGLTIVNPFEDDYHPRPEEVYETI